jgi:hypothetical protein
LNPFAILALLLLGAALVLHLVQRKNAWRQSDAPWPLCAKRPMASPEQVLYQRLVMALPGHIILSRVPVSGVVGAKRGFDAGLWNRRMRHLQYDFVVCAKDASVLAAIELHDSPRSDSLQTSADLTKARAAASAGVRLVRWQAKALPDPAQIQAVFGKSLARHFADVASSANQSWWPPIAGAGQNPPPG